MQSWLRKFDYAFRRDYVHITIELALLTFISVYFLHKKTLKPRKVKPLTQQVNTFSKPIKKINHAGKGPTQIGRAHV
jgi:hypothetical protein